MKKITIIIAVISIIIITVVSNHLKSLKIEINQYDSYSGVIEDYSYVIGCQNTVKCQTEELDGYSRQYVYNTYRDSDDRVIFQFGFFKDSYTYEKQELFKGINAVMPFPEAALPHYADTHMEFRHYLSKLEPDVIFETDNPHDRIALSFNRSISYKELTDYNANLDDLGYAVKFCWVDTYLPNDIIASSKYAAGRPVPETFSEYVKYAEYDTAYGFLLYDHDYPGMAAFDEPAQKFIDIISAHYDDNFMSKELSGIGEELLKKGTLSVDSLEIIGVILEKKDGRQFSVDEVQTIYENDELVTFIYS